MPEMDDKKINHELDTKQWKDLSSSAPELAPVSDKEAILEDERHVVPGNAPEVVEEKSFPQAIDDEGDKEGCTASSTSSSSDEKIPIETTANKVKKSRKLRRALIIGGVSTIIVTIALGVGLGVGLTKKMYPSLASLLCRRPTNMTCQLLLPNNVLRSPGHWLHHHASSNRILLSHPPKPENFKLQLPYQLLSKLSLVLRPRPNINLQYICRCVSGNATGRSHPALEVQKCNAPVWSPNFRHRNPIHSIPQRRRHRAPRSRARMVLPGYLRQGSPTARDVLPEG